MVDVMKFCHKDTRSKHSPASTLHRVATAQKVRIITHFGYLVFSFAAYRHHPLCTEKSKQPSIDFYQFVEASLITILLNKSSNY